MATTVNGLRCGDTFPPEQRLPQEYRLRPIRAMVDRVLAHLSPEFAKLYAPRRRPSVAPETPLRALLLQVLYSVRSKRLFMEQVDLQPAVPQVRRAEYGCRVGPDGVHEASRMSAGRPRRAALL